MKSGCMVVSGALFLAGCGGSNLEEKGLVVLCGNSFLPPTKDLLAQFEAETGTQVEYTVAGSEDLLPHVKQAAQGDILITHDPYLDYTREAKRLADFCHVGFVAPVLAVQSDNPKKIGKLEDLAAADLKVALSDPTYSTCGEMVRDLLKEKGIYDEVMVNVGNRLTRGHSQLGNLLQTETVDAVVMWNGVANTFEEYLDVVPLPYEYGKEINVYIIGLNYSSQPRRVAQFIAFVKEHGESIYAKHGYVK